MDPPDCHLQLVVSAFSFGVEHAFHVSNGDNMNLL